MTWWQYIAQQVEIARDVHKYCHMCRALVSANGPAMVPVEASWNPQEEKYSQYVCPPCEEKYAINDMDWQP